MAFYQSMKSKVRLKMETLRINLNVEGCGIVLACQWPGLVSGAPVTVAVARGSPYSQYGTL